MCIIFLSRIDLPVDRDYPPMDDVQWELTVQMTQYVTLQIARAALEWSGVPRGREARASVLAHRVFWRRQGEKNVRAAWSPPRVLPMDAAARLANRLQRRCLVQGSSASSGPARWTIAISQPWSFPPYFQYGPNNGSVVDGKCWKRFSRTILKVTSSGIEVGNQTWHT